MTALEQFNALNGTRASRSELENILQIAKQENNTNLIYRISKTLNDHPSVSRFDIEIISYPDAPQGLSGAQHTGDYREALDDCGRLRKGWKFVKGNVVKVEKKEKPKKEAKPKKETKTTTKTKKVEKKETPKIEPKTEEKEEPKTPTSKRLEILEKSLEEKKEKYKFIVFIGAFGRISGIYSFQVLTINGYYFGKTFDDGIRIYKPITPFDKVEEAKRILNEQYSEGKDFIIIKFEAEKREEYYSILEKPKPAPEPKPVVKTQNKELPRDFSEDLDFETLRNSHYWRSFDPERRAKSEKRDYNKWINGLYNSYLDQAKENNKVEEYNQTFERLYAKILKKYQEMVKVRTGTFSTAVTGGSGITGNQMNKNLSKQEYERKLQLEIYADIEKAEKKLDDISRLDDKYYKDKAIKSTDKHAIDKLKQKLKVLEDKKDFIKRSEKAWKEYQKTKDFSVFEKNNIPKKEAEEYLDQIERYGFPLITGALTINAKIREVKERIEALEKNTQKEEQEILFEGGKVFFNYPEQRLQIFFDAIPDEATRTALKKKAFKWSPKNKAWQRTLTANANDAIKDLFEKKILIHRELKKTEEEEEKQQQKAKKKEEYLDKLYNIGLKIYDKINNESKRGDIYVLISIYNSYTDTIKSYIKIIERATNKEEPHIKGTKTKLKNTEEKLNDVKVKLLNVLNISEEEVVFLCQFTKNNNDYNLNRLLEFIKKKK
ncbi:MAG: hypothetical protein Q3983_10265 [Capnocytophaga sp.]|nr:hypothetical protein [Capnocytophaga sp.]